MVRAAGTSDIMGIFLRPALTQGEFDTDRDSSTKRMRNGGGGAYRSYDPFVDDYSYQGPAGACDGRAQEILGYRSGGLSN